MISKIVILVSLSRTNKFGSQLLIVLREDYTWLNTVIRSEKSKSIFKQIKPNNNKITNIYLQSLFFLIVLPFLKVFPNITISNLKNYGRCAVGFLGKDKNPSSSLTSLDFSSP